MAANTLPIPQPPRTPSPISDDQHSEHEHPRGLGLDGGLGPAITTDYDYDIQQGISDSPGKEPTSGVSTASASTMLSPAFSIAGQLSPNGSLYTPITPQTAGTDGSGNFPPLGTPPRHQHEQGQQQQRNPFNFSTVEYIAGSPHKASKASAAAAANDALGKRRGHKYRHSSIHISAMDSIIQPPPQRTPLALPASLPIPTRKELSRSLTSHQTLRLAWCACHFIVAGYVQFSASGSLSMTALSRLLLFDAAGATVCVIVDVMGNFEIWKRSSIKHPFGLERADVLAGFGMAVFISFMGLDIFSHGIEHSLENLGSHVPHTSHAHQRVPAGSVDVASLLAIASTLVSAIGLKNHKRIGKATNIPLIAGWGRILGNPSHVLTLSCSLLLLILPLLTGMKAYTLFDTGFSFLIAGLMLTLGYRLGTSLASMLLMSYKSPASGKSNKAGSSVRDVMTAIETEADPAISAVEEARFWQVHYGLCMANLKLRYHGGAGEDMVRIRQRVASLIPQKLGGGGGRWEVSLQMSLERD